MIINYSKNSTLIAFPCLYSVILLITFVYHLFYTPYHRHRHRHHLFWLFILIL